MRGAKVTDLGTKVTNIGTKVTNPSLRPRILDEPSGLFKPEWDDACVAEIDNLLHFGAFSLVSEDSHQPRRQGDPAQHRAPSMTLTLWVLRRKRGGKGEITKYKPGNRAASTTSNSA